MSASIRAASQGSNALNRQAIQAAQDAGASSGDDRIAPRPSRLRPELYDYFIL